MDVNDVNDRCYNTQLVFKCICLCMHIQRPGQQHPAAMVQSHPVMRQPHPQFVYHTPVYIPVVKINSGIHAYIHAYHKSIAYACLIYLIYYILSGVSIESKPFDYTQPEIVLDAADEHFTVQRSALARKRVIWYGDKWKDL